MIQSLDQFNQDYFKGDLSPLVMDLLKSLPVHELEVSGFLWRMGRWMDQCRIPAKHEFCPRGDDRFLGGIDPNLPASELAKRSHQISTDMEEQGLVDSAVEVLNGKGVNAWKNKIGHIAMTPTDLTAFK